MTLFRFPCWFSNLFPFRNHSRPGTHAWPHENIYYLENGASVLWTANLEITEFSVVRVPFFNAIFSLLTNNYVPTHTCCPCKYLFAHTCAVRTSEHMTTHLYTRKLTEHLYISQESLQLWEDKIDWNGKTGVFVMIINRQTFDVKRPELSTR